MSTSEKYFSFGNRRDLNLSDSENKTESLNNLLNNLSLDSGETFISEDLDVIRGISDTNIQPETLFGLSDIAVKQTLIDQNGTQIETIVSPLVTLKDRIENIKISTGKIPAFRGGKGPKAKFFPSTVLNPLSSNNHTIDDLLGSSLNSPDFSFEDFWFTGQFDFIGSLDNSFNDIYGSIYWEGYFSPFIRDVDATAIIRTTGLFILEIDENEDGNWSTINSLYAESRSVFAVSDNVNNTVQIRTEDLKFVALGDRIANTEIIVTNLLGNTITFSEEVNILNGEEIFLEKEIGNDISSLIVKFPIISKNNYLKIRFILFFPNTGNRVDDYQLSFNHYGNDVEYPYFYSEKPSESYSENEIRFYLDDIVSPFQPEMGKSSDYKNFITNKLLFSDYIPKINSNDNFFNSGTVYTLSNTANSNVVSIFSSTERETFSIEEGMFIVPVNSGSINDNNLKITLNKGQRSGDFLNTFFELNNNIPNQNTNLQIRLLSPIGLIKWDYATGYDSGTKILSISDTSNLREEFIVHKIGSSGYTYITEVLNSTDVVLSNDLAVANGEVVTFHSNSGIIDASKDIFCEGVFGKIVNTTVSSGNTIVITDSSGVSLNQVVWLSGLIDDGTGKATVTNISGNIISLSGVNTIKGEIVSGITLTFSPPGTSVNKEQCVIPLDTAPPFIGETYGLSTNGKNIDSSNPTFEVEANSLTFENVNSLVSGTFNNIQTERKMNLNSGAYFIPLKLV